MMRTVTRLDHGWEHLPGDDGPDGTGSWTTVSVPHAWNTSPGGVPAEADRRGPGWYRGDIAAPGVATGRRVFLELRAAGTVADVHVGATHVVQHRGGYSAFRCDLTDALDADGSGRLAVRVDNSPTDDVYPLMGDHTIFGGLYRPVQLIEVDAVHIDLLDHGGPGVVIRQTSLNDSLAVIAVSTRVANDSPVAAGSDVVVRVLDGEGVEVAAATTRIELDPGSVDVADVEVAIDAPRRWDGRRDPHCYRAEVTVGDDVVSLRFGLRTMEIDPDTGFHLNGRPYPLRGVSRHHDVNGTPAASAADIAADLDLVGEIGATAVRLAHYQHPEEVLDGCDERGIVVWAEVPVNAKVSISDPLTNAASQLVELIRQQRHHPSIACWGVQNESVIAEAESDPRPTVEALVALARREDPDRPTAQAQLTLVRPEDPINRLADLNALNLYHGWYFGRAGDVGTALDRHRAANPDVPLGLSEYGADARPEYHSAEPTPGDYTEDYQADFHETYLRAIDERPWLWCTFVWNMFDFASVIRDEGGTRGFNMKGLVTRDRLIRKDAFWWYKANWSTAPVLHICAKRFVHRTEDEIEVKVYSNLPEVRLLVDGRSIGTERVEGRIARFLVPIRPDGTRVEALADGLDDEAVFRRVEAPDDSYRCPTPRRVRGGGLSPWYEDAGIEVDRTRYGTWTPVGELLDDPDTRAILVEEFGTALLEHPQLEMARSFALDFVLTAAGPELTTEQLHALHDRLSAVPKPRE